MVPKSRTGKYSESSRESLMVAYDTFFIESRKAWFREVQNGAGFCHTSETRLNYVRTNNVSKKTTSENASLRTITWIVHQMHGAFEQ